MLKDPQFRTQPEDTLHADQCAGHRHQPGPRHPGQAGDRRPAYTNLNNLLTESTKLVTTIRQDPKKYLTIHLKIF